jgi:hypothetical protein
MKKVFYYFIYIASILFFYKFNELYSKDNKKIIKSKKSCNIKINHHKKLNNNILIYKNKQKNNDKKSVSKILINRSNQKNNKIILGCSIGANISNDLNNKIFNINEINVNYNELCNANTKKIKFEDINNNKKKYFDFLLGYKINNQSEFNLKIRSDKFEFIDKNYNLNNLKYKLNSYLLNFQYNITSYKQFSPFISFSTGFADSNSNGIFYDNETNNENTIIKYEVINKKHCKKLKKSRQACESRELRIPGCPERTQNEIIFSNFKENYFLSEIGAGLDFELKNIIIGAAYNFIFYKKINSNNQTLNLKIKNGSSNVDLNNFDIKKFFSEDINFDSHNINFFIKFLV